MKEEGIDIMGINESNITEKQSKFLLKRSSEYVSFWTSAEENKIKGSGVGIIVHSIWEKHLSKITRCSSYYIDALLVFKKVKILVIVTYIPPNSKEIRKLLQQHIIKKIRESERKDTRVVIMGDFNDIRSSTLDQSNTKSKRTISLPLLAWLESSRCEDSFRKLHPQKKDFTWSNGKTDSRIDYIWATKELSRGLISSKISNAEFVTGSDHRIVQAHYITGVNQKFKPTACDKRLKKKRRVLELEKASDECWDTYTTKLDIMLKGKLNNNLSDLKGEYRGIAELDRLWDIISECIIKSAYKSLPNKEIKASRTWNKISTNSDKMQKKLRILGRLCYTCIEN